MCHLNAKVLFTRFAQYIQVAELRLSWIIVKVSSIPSSDESTISPAEDTVAADELQQMRTPGELATLRPIHQLH